MKTSIERTPLSVTFSKILNTQRIKHILDGSDEFKNLQINIDVSNHLTVPQNYSNFFTIPRVATVNALLPELQGNPAEPQSRCQFEIDSTIALLGFLNSEDFVSVVESLVSHILDEVDGEDLLGEGELSQSLFGLRPYQLPSALSKELARSMESCLNEKLDLRIDEAGNVRCLGVEAMPLDHLVNTRPFGTLKPKTLMEFIVFQVDMNNLDKLYYLQSHFANGYPTDTWLNRLSAGASHRIDLNIIVTACQNLLTAFGSCSTIVDNWLSDNGVFHTLEASDDSTAFSSCPPMTQSLLKETDTYKEIMMLGLGNEALNRLFHSEVPDVLAERTKSLLADKTGWGDSISIRLYDSKREHDAYVGDYGRSYPQDDEQQYIEHVELPAKKTRAVLLALKEMLDTDALLKEIIDPDQLFIEVTGRWNCKNWDLMGTGREESYMEYERIEIRKGLKQDMFPLFSVLSITVDTPEI